MKQIHRNKPQFLLLILSSTVLLSACIKTEGNYAEWASSELKSDALFDVLGPDAWVPSNEWIVEKGQIIAKSGGENTMLVTQKSYQDYRLSLEFWIDAQTNSGVFIHCDSPSKITPFDCYEINIWDDHPKQEYRTGSVVALVSPPLAHVSSVDKWNSMVIEAKNNKLTVHLNGTLTAEIEGGKRRSGFIALQRFNNGEVRFRALQLAAI